MQAKYGGQIKHQKLNTDGQLTCLIPSCRGMELAHN